MIQHIRAEGWERVLGMNARNLFVSRENSLKSIRLVNDKYATKQALLAHSVPVVPTITVVRERWETDTFDWNALPDAWALKPNRGCQGLGILLAQRRDGSQWCTASGRVLSRELIHEHMQTIVEGAYSMEGLEGDWVLFEPLIIPDRTLAGLVQHGLPDIRVICYHNEPVLAMTRLPTVASEGRANLHQGAIGAGVDLKTGRIMQAVYQRRVIQNHPDTDKQLIGLQIPWWDTILESARKCGAATGLGYMGVDVVIDADRGPLVIEVNARPGLEIQNVTGVGLMEQLTAMA